MTARCTKDDSSGKMTFHPPLLAHSCVQSTFQQVSGTSSATSTPPPGRQAKLRKPQGYTSGGGNAVLLSMLAAGGASGFYYFYITEVVPSQRFQVLQPAGSPQASPGEAKKVFDVVPSVNNGVTKVVSVKEELLTKQQKLGNDLEELRAMKQSPEVEAKKKQVKLELRIIENGMTDIEKSFKVK